MYGQIKIGTWNINGLGKGTEKLHDNDFKLILNKFDIFSLIETWHTQNTKVSLRGFDSIAVTRKKKYKKGRHSGGILIYIKNAIRKGVSQITTWLKLKKSFFGLQKDIFLCITYRRPSNKRACDEYFNTMEEELLKYSSQGNICITGDINARTGIKEDFIEIDNITDELTFVTEDKTGHKIRNNLDMKTNTAGLQLLNLCKVTDMMIINGRKIGNLTGHYTYYTNNGSSVVDYTIADSLLIEDILYHTIDLPSYLSDHCLQKFGIRTCYKPNKTNSSTSLDPLPQKFIWDRNSPNNYPFALLQKEIINKLTDFQFKHFTDDLNGINEATETLTSIMIEAGKHSLKLPRRKKNKTQRNKNKWFDQDCDTKRRLFRQLQKSLQKDPKNPFLRGLFNKEKKAYKKLLRHKKQLSKDRLISELSVLGSTNPKMYWQIIDKLRNPDENEPLSSDIPTEDWVTHFKNLSLQSYADDSLNEEIENLEINNPECTLNDAITIREIKLNIKKLKNNKACGEDLILNEMIKSGSNILLPSIAKLFNMVLSNGKFPELWNTSLQSPIFKSGNHLDPNNYRGISITSCMGKLFTTILQSRLLSYLEDNNKLSPKQAAFRPGYSTTDHLYTLKSLINKYVHVNKEKLFVCFVDFRKAFDKVWRNGLFVKLLRMGISGNFYNLIKHMYKTTKSKVKLPLGLSTIFEHNTGIKQGDGLSPLLFDVFINDLNNIFDDTCDPPKLGTLGIHNLLYADDLIIMSTSKEGLQRGLDKLDTYCKTWHLEINSDKTKVMVLSKSGKIPKDFQAKYNKILIQNVKYYKYLGLILYNNGNFVKGTSDLKIRAQRAWFKCKSSLFSNSTNNVHLLLNLFDKLVKPILLYGVEIWGPDFLTKLFIKEDLKIVDSFFCEIVHNRACKSILGVRKNSSNIAVRAELGRTPLYPYIVGAVFKYWYKLLTQTKNPILKEAYLFEIRMKNTGKQSWLTPILDIHDLSSTNIGKNRTFSLIKNMIQDLQNKYITYILDYFKKLRTNGANDKLRTYCMMKKKYNLEQYLTLNVPKSYRTKICSLRIGSHNLEIELGRHRDPPVPAQNRSCKYCLPNQYIGDELHFMMQCKLNETLRPDLMSVLGEGKLFSQNDTLTNFITLMTECLDNVDNCMLIGKYIHESFKQYNMFMKQYPPD